MESHELNVWVPGVSVRTDSIPYAGSARGRVPIISPDLSGAYHSFFVFVFCFLKKRHVVVEINLLQKLDYSGSLEKCNAPGQYQNISPFWTHKGIIQYLLKMQKGRQKRWLSGWEYLKLFKRTRVWLPASISRWFTITCNPSFRGATAPSGLSRHWYRQTHRHTYI